MADNNVVLYNRVEICFHMKVFHSTDGTQLQLIMETFWANSEQSLSQYGNTIKKYHRYLYVLMKYVYGYNYEDASIFKNAMFGKWVCVSLSICS